VHRAGAGKSDDLDGRGRAKARPSGVSNTRRQFMGDKSPKAKEKAKKQDTLDKNQKKATAATKASQQGSAGAAKKGR
jgi:hypothetical protein